MYRIQAEERKERKIRRICRRRHYELKRIYPENLGRSDHYRRDFFSYYPRPLGGYRCRYCHRRIPDKKLCIDHIYPIYRTKTGNDFLAAAASHRGCERCAQSRSRLPPLQYKKRPATPESGCCAPFLAGTRHIGCCGRFVLWRWSWA